MKTDVARKYAERLQAFFESGKTALEYAEDLRKKNFDWASAFVHNYSCYNQFISMTLFGELRQIRLKARERYLERKGVSV